MPGAIIVLLFTCIALLLVPMLRTAEGIDTAQKPVPDQAAIEEPAVQPLELKVDDVPLEPLLPDDLDMPEHAMEPVDVPDDEMPSKNIADVAAVVEDAGNMPEPDPVDDDTVQKDDKPDAEPTPNNVEMGRFRIIETIPEPLELTEARQLYDEKVEQAIKPYREELEKELATAKEQGELQAVLKLETELKQVRAAKLTEAKPEKRSLASTKVRCRKDIETARETYRKRLTEIVKELTQSDRIDEAKIVQEQVDHFDKPRPTTLTPKRITTPALPVVRTIIEIDTNGKGRWIVGKGMTTDSLAPISSTAFPLTAFPKAQAFRRDDGLGRVVFDIRDPHMLDVREQSGWTFWRKGGVFDAERKALRFATTSKDSAMLAIHRYRLPCRIVCETLEQPGYGPSYTINIYHKNGLQSDIHFSGHFESGRFHAAATCFLPGWKELKPFLMEPMVGEVGQAFQKSFQLPKEMITDIRSVQFVVWTDKRTPNLPEDEFRLVLMDILARHETSGGFTVAEESDLPTVKKVYDNGPASRAGLKVGDEIVRFNGTKRTASEIMDILNGIQFGDLLTVVVIRDGEEKAFRFHAE